MANGSGIIWMKSLYAQDADETVQVEAIGDGTFSYRLPLVSSKVQTFAAVSESTNNFHIGANIVVSCSACK